MGTPVLTDLDLSDDDTDLTRVTATPPFTLQRVRAQDEAQYSRSYGQLSWCDKITFKKIKLSIDESAENVKKVFEGNGKVGLLSSIHVLLIVLELNCYIYIPIYYYIYILYWLELLQQKLR